MEPRAAGRHSPIPAASGSPGSSPGRCSKLLTVIYFKFSIRVLQEFNLTVRPFFFYFMLRATRTLSKRIIPELHE